MSKLHPIKYGLKHEFNPASSADYSYLEVNIEPNDNTVMVYLGDGSGSGLQHLYVRQVHLDALIDILEAAREHLQEVK